MILSLLLGLAVTLFSGSLQAADAPILESVEGNPPAVSLVHLGAGSQESVGYEFAAGDEIHLGAQQAARVLFGDGSQLTLSAGGIWRWDGEQGGAPWSTLGGGYAYVTVEHPAGPPSPSHRFVIQTASAVLGVRGTEFTVDQASSGETQMHTLNGQVEAAPDAGSLRAGRVEKVPAGQFTRAERGAVSPAAAFDRAAYAKEIAAKHPRAQALVKRAPRARAKLRETWTNRRKERVRRPAPPTSPTTKAVLPPSTAPAKAPPKSKRRRKQQQEK